MRSRASYALILALVVVSLLLVRDHGRLKNLERNLHALRQPRSSPSSENENTKASAAPAPRSIPKTTGAKNQPAETAQEITLESALEKWIARIDLLKSWLNQRPDLQTPELKLLTNDDWFYATLGNALITEDELKRAYRILNHRAETTRNALIIETRIRYSDQNGSPASPPTIEQLIPYLIAPLDPEILRSAMTPSTRPH